MKTTWFITIAALTFSGLAAAQTVNQLIQEKEGRTNATSSVSGAFTAPIPNWMDHHLKAKTGRYSPAEETRQDDARSSTAFRDASQPAAPLTPPLTSMEQRYLVKLGRLPGR